MMGTACDNGRSGPGSRTINGMLPHDHILRRVDRLLDNVRAEGRVGAAL